MTLEKGLTIVAAKCDVPSAERQSIFHIAEQRLLSEAAARGNILSSGTVVRIKDELNRILAEKGYSYIGEIQTILGLVEDPPNDLEARLLEYFRFKMKPYFDDASGQLEATKKKLKAHAAISITLETDIQNSMRGWEADLQILAARAIKTSMAPQNVTYNVIGNNARVNHLSTDNSSNVVNITADQLFNDIRSALEAVPDQDKRAELVAESHRLERLNGQVERKGGYLRFIDMLEKHVSILGNLLSPLVQWTMQ